MGDAMLVRLKPFDPRRGQVLRRYTYRGVKFHEERGWYRVEPAVAAYLKTVRQVASDPHAPLAFDVLTAKQAQALDDQESADAKVRRGAADATRVAQARPADGVLKTSDLAPADAEDETKAARKRGR